MSGYDIEKILRWNEEAARAEQAEAQRKAQEAQIVQLPIDELEDMPQEWHKYRPPTQEYLDELRRSIQLNGILNALLVRRLPDGKYQILAGQTRRMVARELGYKTVPCVVKELPDDGDAILAMNADNQLHRELLPSERGWAYRQEMEIRSRQGWRSDLTSTQVVSKLRADEQIGSDIPASPPMRTESTGL